MTATSALACVLLVSTGCVQSRYDQLRSQSKRVNGKLLDERDSVLARPEDDPQRSARLEHLTTLKYTHSLADVGLATASHVLKERELVTAYDVLGEVYDVIDWNIPLMPGIGTRALPKEFGTMGLDYGVISGGRLVNPGSTGGGSPSGYAR